MKKIKLIGKRIISLSIIIVMVLAMVACTKSNDSDENYKLTLRLSHVFAPDEQLTKTMDLIAQRVYEKTDGAIEILTFPQGQLGTYKEGLEYVARGAHFISVEDPSYLGDYIPDFKALVGPMLYTSYDEYSKIIETDLVKDMERRAEEKGIKILGLDYIFGFRNIMTNKVIKTPEDMKGVKLRTPGSKLFIDTINSMGATASSLPFAETISAVQQGVVDGLEGSEFSNIGTKCYEVVKNVALTKHFLGTCGAYINIDVFNSIPEKYRNILEEEFAYGAKEMIGIMNESYDKTVEDLKSYGVKFNEVDTESFVEATKVVYDKMDGVTPGIYDKIQAELEKIRNNSGE